MLRSAGFPVPLRQPANKRPLSGGITITPFSGIRHGTYSLYLPWYCIRNPGHRFARTNVDIVGDFPSPANGDTTR